jgi:hypothetical protein
MEREAAMGGGDKEGERESVATLESNLMNSMARSPKAPKVSMAKGVRKREEDVRVSR